MEEVSLEEVIFLCGPPFSGKTSYYEQHLKSSHERVSASEFYQANPSRGLRHFVLHLLKIFGEGIQGKGVVIDDENWSRKTRQSCMQSIKAKLPSCKFICHVCKPGDAFECLWRREWVLAEYFSKGDNKPGHHRSPSTVDLSDTEARIHKWFLHESGEHVAGLDAVEESEEWHQIKEIKTSLQPRTNYKFEVPAVFLDWQALMGNSTNHLVEALKIWKHEMLCGRVIVLATDTDEVSDDKDSQDSDPGDIFKSTLKKIQAKTKALAGELSVPVFYLIIKEPAQSGSFTKSPNPGILSFLQRLHHIDIHHPGTVFIYQSERSRATEFAQTGIKQFAAGSVCRNPEVLAHCQGGRVSGSAHESILDFDYVLESKEQIPSVIPHLNEIISDDADDVRTYVGEERWGRVLGVSYKDKVTLQRFQQEYMANASHISAEGSKMRHKSVQDGVKRGSSSIPVKCNEPSSHQEDGRNDRVESKQRTALPSWMTPKRRKNEEENEDQINAVNKKYDGLPKTIYCMTVAELRDVALLFLNQDGGSDGSSQSLSDPTEPDDAGVIVDDALGAERMEQSDDDYNAEIEDRDADQGTAEGSRRKTSLPGDEDRRVLGEDGDDRDRRKAKPGSGDGSRDDGVASIITDLFVEERRPRKPPPKKKTVRSPFSTSSTMLWSDEEEEESSYQPDTTSTSSKRNPQVKEKSKGNKPQIQDFSFLDEIF
nr:uncharacterized protein LOC129273635 [Lytechinus pictus]